jgi:hypothetical protein
MLDYQAVKSWAFPVVERAYTVDDTMFYALAVGVGADPVDERQLRFVNDTAGTPLALPTMAVVLGWPGSWMTNTATGIDFSKIVHGEETVEWTAPSRHRGPSSPAIA